ncbi:hypothetical protein ACFTWH_03725 [Streptomyces sp. NPDC057011]|uniref:hypothetical protein n=1 Tax=unclassified Streptomyces TaxID=2593676 RepID=UPI003625AAF6
MSDYDEHPTTDARRRWIAAAITALALASGAVTALLAPAQAHAQGLAQAPATAHSDHPTTLGLIRPVPGALSRNNETVLTRH